MIKYQIEKQEVKIPESITCDVCKKTYSYTDQDDFETQEFTCIHFRGGYGSIFGDDVSFETDICQHCLKEKLGEYIREIE